MEIIFIFNKDEKNLIYKTFLEKWIKIIDQKLISSIKTRFSDDNELKKIILISEITYPKLDYKGLFTEKNESNSEFSLIDYIKLKLNNQRLYNFKPYYEFVSIDYGETFTEFFQIGISKKSFNTLPEEKEIYFRWKEKIDKDLYTKLQISLAKYVNKCVIYTERTVKNYINHNKIFEQRIGKNKIPIREYLILKLDIPGLFYTYEPFGQFIDDPLGLNTKLFQFGLNIKGLSTKKTILIKTRFT